MVNIKDLNKAEVLFALWHASHAQGMSFMGLPTTNFTLERAEEWVNGTPKMYFDYVDGHVIKCDISGDEFDERLYDRDCGEGAAAKAIENLRKNGVNALAKSDDSVENESMMGLIDMLFRAAAERRVKEDNDEN